MIELSFGRRSVCMGDDVYNGTYQLSLPDGATLGDLIGVLLHGGCGNDWPIPYTGANSGWVVQSNIGDLADVYTGADGEWNIRYRLPARTPLKRLGIRWTYGERNECDTSMRTNWDSGYRFVSKKTNR